MTMNVIEHRAVTLLGCLACLLVGILAFGDRTARADFGFAPGQASQLLSTTQAGAHPDLRLNFALNKTPNAYTGDVDGALRSVDVSLPAGLVGNAQATPVCDVGAVLTDPMQSGGEPPCPLNTVVGFVTATLNDGYGQYSQPAFIFNIKPYKNEPAAFGMWPYFPARLDTSVGPDGGYRIRATTNDIPEALPIEGIQVRLFGVPADHNGPYVGGPEQFADGNGGRIIGDPGQGKRIPLLTNPTACTGQPLVTDLSITDWSPPGVTKSTQLTNPAVSGCDQLKFRPTIRVVPSTRVAGAPAGYSVDVDIPQSDDPNALATPNLEDAKIVFPEGVVLSPSVAHGLDGCSDAQIGLRTNATEQCPVASKIGTIRVTTPLLADPLDGEVYVGSPLPGNRYRVFFSINSHGVIVKLEGKVTLDPQTGQITSTFLDNPHLPFSNLHVEFQDGPNAPLANPSTCGVKTVTSTLTSDAGQTASPSGTFSIDSGCNPRAFAPTWTSGSQGSAAGASSPFELRISRNDGDQEIDRVSADMPAGLLGYVSKIGRCSAVAAAAGTCPASSQIGETTVSAGPGSDPFAVDGQVFLTDGYDGAPFGVLFHTHVVAGPYDLGDVNVRGKITVDPVTAALHVESASLPRILEGVPLQIRSMRVLLDRDGFMRNPTSCGVKAITGVLTSISGVTSAVSSPFQVAGCDQLALTPDLDMALSGAKQTTDGKHPAIQAVLTQPAGQAAIKKASVRLPLSLALDPDNAQALCEFVDGQKTEPTCPAGSIVGTATATTPILNEPLSGPVYFVKNIRLDAKTGRQIKTLPTLVIPLKGEGVSLVIRGSSSVVDDHLVTTFDNLPDAPVSKFVLNLNGGQHGILVVSDADICKSTQVAEQEIDGQNNKQADAKLAMGTPDCPLKVLSKSFGRTTVKIAVGGLSDGKLTLSGTGLKKTTKTILNATVATITVPLTQAGRARHPTAVKLSFTKAGTRVVKASKVPLRVGAKASRAPARAGGSR
jgi:hypothetical protein